MDMSVEGFDGDMAAAAVAVANAVRTLNAGGGGTATTTAASGSDSPEGAGLETGGGELDRDVAAGSPNVAEGGAHLSQQLLRLHHRLTDLTLAPCPQQTRADRTTAAGLAMHGTKEPDRDVFQIVSPQ